MSSSPARRAGSVRGMGGVSPSRPVRGPAFAGPAPAASGGPPARVARPALPSRRAFPDGATSVEVQHVSIGGAAVRPRPRAQDGPRTIPRRERTGPGVPARWYLGLAAVLVVVNWAADTYWAASAVFGAHRPVSFAGDRFLEGWVRWDSTWYRAVATDGYSYLP